MAQTEQAAALAQLTACLRNRVRRRRGELWGQDSRESADCKEHRWRRDGREMVRWRDAWAREIRPYQELRG